MAQIPTGFGQPITVILFLRNAFRFIRYSILRFEYFTRFVLLQPNLIGWPCFNALTGIALRWRHIKRNGVPNHQPLDYLLKRLFRRRLKKTSKLSVAGLCAGNSPVTGEFPAQRACNAENVSIWWRHHGYTTYENRNRRWDNTSSQVCINWLRNLYFEPFNALRPTKNGRQLQTTFWNVFSCMKIVVVWFKLKWNLFQGSINNNHCFR